MATLKICVQKSRADGTWPVYIRVTHKSKHGYIKTDKLVWGKGINPKTKEIKDQFVIQQVSITVVDYIERLNKRNISDWTLEEVVAFLKTGDEDISFSDYCRKYIHSMQDAGQVRNARNYEMAIKHFEKHVGEDVNIPPTHIQVLISTLELEDCHILAKIPVPPDELKPYDDAPMPATRGTDVAWSEIEA